MDSVEVVDFRPIDRRRADQLFSALPSESKWGEVFATLTTGSAAFVPAMTRNQLEAVRTIVNRRGLGRLRSKTTMIEGVEGRILRLVKHGGS